MTCARIAPGLRRVAPDALPIKAQTDHFDGLPDGLTPGQVLATFKRASTNLGLSAVRDLVDQLMAFTQPQDWRPGSRPIVWPSNATLADRLDVCQRQVRRLLSRLVDAGIIVPVDSPEGHRWGHRDASDRIVKAYGFDLSPLAVRHAEFAAVADQADAERKARSDLRRRLTIARKAIQQLAETAVEHALGDRDWIAWLEQARAVAAEAAGEGIPLAMLQAAAANLEHWRAEGETALINALRVKESSAEDQNVRPITTTNQPEADKSATCISDSEKEGNSPAGRATVGISVALPNEPPAATPRFVVRVSPPLQNQLLTSSPTWSDIVEAADRLRHQLGISRAAWIDACHTLGRYHAATAVAIIAAKGDSIRSPGGYLRGMIARGRDGELYLLRSLHGLAEQGRRAAAQHHS